MVNYRELLCQCHGRAYAQRFHDDFMKQLDTLSAVRNSVVKDVMRRGTVDRKHDIEPSRTCGHDDELYLQAVLEHVARLLLRFSIPKYLNLFI